MNPLVSILIPAYNAESWIEQTIESAINQTYSNIEIIVVNDGSRDKTLEIVKRYETSTLKVIHQDNAGGGTARNTALAHAQGDYIQWLDHDDILAATKISEQVQHARSLDDERLLLSGAFGTFYFCPDRAKITPGPLWADLSPLDYFYIKFERDEWLHTTCWLVGRKVAEKAGPWLDLRSPDDDGEYFCRVVAASAGIIFVPTAKSYWRVGNPASFSSSRENSIDSLRALLESSRRCIAHFRSLEDSDRSRKACVTFLRNRLIYYYPRHRELLNEIYALAEELGGSLSTPPLLPQYEVVRALFGWEAAKRAGDLIGGAKQRILRSIDKVIENRSRQAPNYSCHSQNGC